MEDWVDSWLGDSIVVGKGSIEEAVTVSSPVGVVDGSYTEELPFGGMVGVVEHIDLEVGCISPIHRPLGSSVGRDCLEWQLSARMGS